MPKFGELLATDVWAAAARTLTDISAEEIFDLPEIAAAYPAVDVVSGAGANTFGEWVELSADVGVGKRLLWVQTVRDDVSGLSLEMEFGEGASGSEVAITRFGGWGKILSTAGQRPWWGQHLWRSITDNARLSARVKDNSGGAMHHFTTVGVA